MFLFIDTTKAITVGILNKDFQWISYEFFPDAKGSALIHKIIHDQYKKHDLKLLETKALIQVAGPGSYTGMRVSEGISQIFDWQGFETYSFYHYEVPKILGVSKGIWLANAFKGEYFIYKWDANEEKSNLIKKDDFSLNSDEKLFSSFELEEFELNLTSELIKNDSQLLFKKVISENMKKTLYYYRTLEEEYNKK